MLQPKITFIILAASLLIGCKNESVVDSKLNPTTYEKAWRNLVNTNNAIAFDSDIHLSDSEMILDKNLSELRERFIESMTQNKQSVFNKSFYELRPAIDTSRLYKILTQMPKGGLLHSHSGGVTDAKWIITHAKEYDECYVFTQKDNDSYVYGQLGVFQKELVPQGFVNLKEKIKYNLGFEDELYKLLILERESLCGYMDIWGEFEKRFDRINDLIAYRPFFKEYYKKAFLDMLEDNIQHLEIRFIFGDLYDLEGNQYSNDIVIQDLKDALLEVQKVDPEFTLKLIYSSFKFFDNEGVRKEIEKAFRLKQQHPELITGFDLVAEEDALNSISYYRENWLQLDSLEKVYGFELPLFLHAGESNSRYNKNLFDIPLLKNYRIGHGLNLVLFPALLKEIKEKGVLVEINPLSNQILGYVNDLRHHPGKTLLNHGVQCSISSDDPGVFGYEGLGYDFWSIVIAWELDLSAIKKLVFNSIEYSTLTEDEKQIARKELNKRWDTFITQSNKLFE